MRSMTVFLLATVGVFIIDQGIKMLFLEGYFREGSCIDLVLHFNKGVAFSMFAFLGEYLKWIQALLVVGMLLFMLKEGYIQRYGLALGFVMGGAVGNLYDRFAHGAVVDYVAWHCGFEFAVFNFADVAIDLGIAWVLLASYLQRKQVL